MSGLPRWIDDYAYGRIPVAIIDKQLLEKQMRLSEDGLSHCMACVQRMALIGPESRLRKVTCLIFRRLGLRTGTCDHERQTAIGEPAGVIKR